MAFRRRGTGRPRTVPVSRRAVLGATTALGAAALGGGGAGARHPDLDAPAGWLAAAHAGNGHRQSGHGGNRTVGTVDHAANGFTPMQLATEFATGRTERLVDGRTVRHFEIAAIERDIEIAPGVLFPAWTYDGRVPGPTIRATEGDLLRIHFTNAGTHPHSMHFHGIHAARMDGVPGAGMVEAGESFTYEFTAAPFGCHLYHCHAFPLKRHVHKGLYGAFIVDPDPGRHGGDPTARGRLLGTVENHRWQEFVMVMNGFDTNFDDENEFYAVNTIPFAYDMEPIRLERARPVRLYLVNMTEFDPINSFHLHGNFFDYYDHGTTLTPTLRTVDTVMQCQAQRGIVEFSFAGHEPGRYMFHAHQSEFTELGWMSHFEVV